MRLTEQDPNWQRIQNELDQIRETDSAATPEIAARVEISSSEWVDGLRRRITEASDHVTRLKQIQASISHAVWEAELALERLRKEAESPSTGELSCGGEGKL